MAGMFIGYDPHTKGYRVKIGDKVVVSRNVYFVEVKDGAITIGVTAREVIPYPQSKQVLLCK